jgi:hypoxanthine-DNA glycosylase
MIVIDKVHSFAPVASHQATRLILGTMPGAASLKASEYYAHPRNAFWAVMEDAVGIPRSLSYLERISLLRTRGFALWDVLHACARTSSLDSDIVPGTMVANDFSAFLSSTPLIREIYFNGAKAESIYLKQVVPSLSALHRAIPRRRLPSTSPANARLTMEAKMAAWSVIANDA